jgi:hypothetical protein
MNRQFGLGVVASIAAVCAAAPQARADDFAPPWYRGLPLSTRAQWEFSQAPTSFFDIYADSFTAITGPAQYPLFGGFPAKAEVDLASNWAWVVGDGDGGLTPAPGVAAAAIGFKMPNFVDNLDVKLLRVQLTYQVILPISATPGISEVQGWYGFNGSLGPVLGVPDGPLSLVTTIHAFQDWTISPNPAWELIAITVPQNVILDEIVIDAVSIPTPAGAVLLLGGVAMLARRRR